MTRQSETESDRQTDKPVVDVARDAQCCVAVADRQKDRWTDWWTDGQICATIRASLACASRANNCAPVVGRAVINSLLFERDHFYDYQIVIPFHSTYTTWTIVVVFFFCLAISFIAVRTFLRVLHISLLMCHCIYSAIQLSSCKCVFNKVSCQMSVVTSIRRRTTILLNDAVHVRWRFCHSVTASEKQYDQWPQRRREINQF